MRKKLIETGHMTPEEFKKADEITRDRKINIPLGNPKNE
jgi:hypothetical protein